jgi:hypothetical protein
LPGWNGAFPGWRRFILGSTRQVADVSGFMKNILAQMPHANRFQGGDGLNTAQIRWMRRDLNQGINSASAYGGDANIERKQFNIKVDHNFSEKHKANVGYSVERDQEGTNFSDWPGNPHGLTRRAPWVLTSAFTSTLSATMINEFRFGVRYNVLNEFNPWEAGDDVETAKKFLLTTNGYPVVFNNNPGVNSGGVNGTLLKHQQLPHQQRRLQWQSYAGLQLWRHAELDTRNACLQVWWRDPPHEIGGL